MLNRTIAKFLFYAVAVILLVWTSSLTYSFLSMALPNTFWMIPLLGLVVFDVGMVSWLFVFLSHAEGAIQRAVAITLTMFNFLGVGLMVIAEILLDGQQMVQAPEMLGTAAIWGIGIWTIVNVLGLLIFHLGDNNARREMAMQSERDAVFDAALKNLTQQRAVIQEELARQLGTAMLDDLIREVRADADRNGTPDILERGRQSASGHLSAHNAPRHDGPMVAPPSIASTPVEQGASGSPSANGRGSGGGTASGGANFQ